MGKAPKIKETADAGAAAPAEAKPAASAPILSEGDGSSAGVSITALPTEGDAAASATETAPEVAQAPVTDAATPQDDAAEAGGAPLPDEAGSDVLALVLSPILRDGEPLQIDETVILTPAEFDKLAAAGAVTRAEVE